MRTSSKHFILIILVCFIVEPFIIQGAYTSEPFTELGADYLDKDNGTFSIGYINTTGNFVSSGYLAETDAGNGIVTAGPATLTSQDLDKYADFQTAWATTATIWNASMFSSITMTSPVTCIGVRIIVGAVAGKRFEVWAGWQGATYEEMLIPRGSYIYSDATSLTYFYISAAQRASIEDWETYLAASGIMHFRFKEANADQLVNGASVTIELHFYTSTGTDLFFQYLLYAGILNLVIALAMTKAFNPLGYRRRRRRYRPRRRYFRRRRYRPRRYSRRRRRY